MHTLNTFDPKELQNFEPWLHVQSTSTANSFADPLLVKDAGYVTECWLLQINIRQTWKYLEYGAKEGEGNATPEL